MASEINIDYKKLNLEEIKKFYENSKIDFDPKKKITEKQFNENMSKLITPSINVESNSNSENDKYVSKVSDPYKRMLQLKIELLQNKNNIDKIISQYNDVSSKIDISDVNNYSLLYSNVQKYKNKIDSFINYDIIKKSLNSKGYESDSDSDEEEDEQKKLEKAKQNKIKYDENKQNILKKREENEKILKQLEENTKIVFKGTDNIKSIYEKYNVLSNNLISKLNNIDSDLNSFTKYKVCSNPDYSLTILKTKIIDVESQISKIENMIGEYDFNLHKSTIFGSLNRLLKLNNENNKDWITSRYENLRAFEGMLGLLNGEADNVQLLNTYKQICEGYMIYLSMKKFEDVISYLKKRINAIKSIILNSEQFEFDIKELNELIKKNEGSFELLKFKYLQTLESFSNLEEILKEINNLDATIKNKI